MKAIILSVKPEWVKKILNGEKTIEIRKTMPKYELPVKVYIYCTKNKKNTNEWHSGDTLGFDSYGNIRFCNYCSAENTLNGKVVAEFTLNKVDFIKMPANITKDFMKKCCMSGSELMKYLDGMFFKSFYAWHIDDLKIYDEPKELGCFFKSCIYAPNAECYPENCKLCGWNVLTRPPQSYCYVEERDFSEV